VRIAVFLALFCRFEVHVTKPADLAEIHCVSLFLHFTNHAGAPLEASDTDSDRDSAQPFENGFYKKSGSQNLTDSEQNNFVVGNDMV
jgi:hypothetical protein